MDSSSRTLLAGLIVALVVVVILAYAYRGSHVTETTNLPGTSKQQGTPPPSPTTPPATPPPAQPPTPPSPSP